MVPSSSESMWARVYTTRGRRQDTGAPRVARQRGAAERAIRALPITALLITMPPIARAQAASRDVIAVDTIAPGVVHSAIVRAGGPFHVNVVAVDLRARRYVVASARAYDSLRGRERPSDIVRRWRAKG